MSDRKPALHEESLGLGAPVEAQERLEGLGYAQELRRTATTFDLVVYGLVFMLPIAPWAIFGAVYNLSEGMVALVYLVGLVTMMITALSYGSMSRAFPLAGGVFAYVGRGIHPYAGFFAGWLMLLDYLLVPALLYIFAAESMIGLFPDTPRWVWGVALVLINVVINLLGVSSLTRMTRLFLLMELIFVGIFVVLAIKALTDGSVPQASWTFDPLFNSSRFSFALVAGALSIAVLSFLGFDGIATMAEETTGDSRAPGRAMVLALLTVASLFILQTWLASALAGSFKPFGDSQVGNAFFDIVATISSSGMVTAFLVCNILAMGIANAMAAQAATSRLLFSMARDGQLPKQLRKLNSRQVPSVAIIAVGVLSSILVVKFAGQIEFMSSMVNVGALTSFMLLHITVIWYHVKRQGSRRYIRHLLLPLIGFVIIGYVLLNAAQNALVAGIIWLAVGAIVFGINLARGKALPFEAEGTQPGS